MTLQRWLSSSIVEETELPLSEEVGFRVHDLSTDGNQILFERQRRLWIRDLKDGTSRELSSFGATRNRPSAFDPSGTIVVTADARGGGMVGLVGGGDPHLLLGHQGDVGATVSPDGRWIASGGSDSTIRLWPMPDFSRPAVHTLPRDQLLAKLRSLTNLRVAEDPESTTGWKLDVGPFPGWEIVPEW